MKDDDARIDRLLAEFGIDRQGLCYPMQPEAEALESLGLDTLGREQFATPATVRAWQDMRLAAGSDGIVLEIVSAFRSVDYQCTLIRNKLERGQAIDDIMKVNAAPGFSEHHTGRALDLTTPGCEILTEAFELTPAFDWLSQHASRFRFVMSYPRDNAFGIDYEPWHWAYNGDNA